MRRVCRRDAREKVRERYIYVTIRFFRKKKIFKIKETKKNLTAAVGVHGEAQLATREAARRGQMFGDTIDIAYTCREKRHGRGEMETGALHANMELWSYVSVTTRP